MIESGVTAPEGADVAVRLPQPARLFALRADRLAALAPAHALPEWLRLLSRVAAGQAAAVREIRPRAPAPRAAPDAVRGPGAATPLAPLAGGGRPLDPGALRRDDAWRRILGVIVSAAAGPGLPAATVQTLRRLETAAPADLESIADGVLAGDVPPDQVAAAPFIGAALHAWLASLAAALDVAALPPAEGACPACGGPPVAGRVRRNDRRRDVTCALCATEWNVPRVRCAVCDTSASPAYFHVDPEPGVKAEACPTCRRYLKLVDEEKRPGADPAADDAATLTLDLLVGEEGFTRAGPNLYVGP